MNQNCRPSAGRISPLAVSLGCLTCIWCVVSGCSTNEYPDKAAGNGGRPSTDTSVVDKTGGAASQISGGGMGNITTAVETGGVPNLATGGSAPTEVGGQNGNAGQAGAASEICSAGLSSCPGEPACTTNLQTGTASGVTFNNCGSCGATCSLSNATSATCAVGKCVSTCGTGYGDCNAGAINDGCEMNLSVSPAACGACGRACSTAGTLTVTCTTGTCTPICAPKYADCNLDLGSGTDDGCEVYLDQLTRCGSNCANGVTCSTNQVCNAGICGAPQGLVVLTVPLTASNQIQRYADKLLSLPDLSGSEIVLRVYAPGATGGTLAVYSQDKDYTSGGWESFSLATLSAGWSDIKLKVGNASGSFDPTSINQITLEVTSGSIGPWANPTVIYVDSIRSTNGVLNDTFDATKSGFVSSSMQVIEGATLDWVNALP